MLCKNFKTKVLTGDNNFFPVQIIEFFLMFAFAKSNFYCDGNVKNRNNKSTSLVLCYFLMFLLSSRIVFTSRYSILAVSPVI